MKLSVIIPVLNELNHLDELLVSIKHLDLIPKEILLVDGGSVDGTRQKIYEYSQKDRSIILIENPDKYVSQGFNKAFNLAKGTYISLIGAHAEYPPNYFQKCIEVIEKGECDAAGGFLIQKGKTTMGDAIALAMSSKFGVGDTAFRTEPRRMYVDSVAFAVYHRKIFETIGLLDEELIRNQDDEFHYRLNRAGFRILMLPDLQIVYYVRDSLSKLFSQYYQYGYYKPLVFKKVSSGLRIRHLIPSLFILYLVGLPFAIWWPHYLLPLAAYVVIAIIVSISAKTSWKVRWRMPMVFPVLHIAYGLGFLKGLPTLWKK